MEEQLNLISEDNCNTKSKKEKNCIAFIDGAARGNPGPSGAGIFIKKNSEEVIKKSFYLGKKTNNQAEYLALAIAVLLLKEECDSGHKMEFVSDSELLVKQMNGIYKVKNPILKKIKNFINLNLNGNKCTFRHVRREYNKIADNLANVAVDKKILLPEKFVLLLKKYEIL